MGYSKIADQRYFPRYHTVSDNFDGRLYLEADMSEIDGQVVDVSRDGIGVLADYPLAAGDRIVLSFHGRTLTFTVRHCQEDLIYRGKFRAGMMRIGETKENVALIFSTLGLLSS